MFPASYRLTVVGCALSWLLVGFHLPALHQMMHHDRQLPWTVLAGVALLTVIGVGSIWLLVRAPAAWMKPPGSRAAAP